MDPLPIDLPTFTDLRDTVGHEFAKELVDTFLEEAPLMLGQLRAALSAGDVDSYRRAAHSLKSNCATFGAMAMAGMARDVELTGYAGDSATDAAVLDALDAAYAGVAAQLTELARD